MTAIITNIFLLKNAGIFTERTANSTALNLRKFNLVYGFNGSGKTTLSRIFASLEAGSLHPKLPQNCLFEITLSDGTKLGVPSNPCGLERRMLVFNSDFIEKNLQWQLGKASPVFFIGAEQSEKAAELANCEKSIIHLQTWIVSANY